MGHGAGGADMIGLLTSIPMRLWAYAAVAVALTGALVSGYLYWEKQTEAKGAAPYILAIAQQKAEAAQLLASETAKVLMAERKLTEFHNQQEVVDHANQSTVTALALRVKSLADSAGRLRDPHGTASRQSGSGATSPTTASADNSAANTGQGTGLLSVELSDFLQRQAVEADAVNIAYRACRAYSEAVRSSLTP